MLETIEQVSRRIWEGQALLLAGDEPLLRALPRGNWIAGTIPYFIDDAGGVCSRERIHVTPMPAWASAPTIRSHWPARLPRIFADAPDHGFSALLLPAGSAVHLAYARDAATYADAFMKPVIGWIAGVHVSEIGVKAPKVVNGATGECTADQAVVLDVPIPEAKRVEIDIVNVFRSGDGDTIRFPQTGFETSQALVNGKPADFAAYLEHIGADTRLPLTADYNGSVVNVSFQSVDQASGVVKFYAPVFEDVEYKLAAPVGDYVAEFECVLGNGAQRPLFACNCILNYLYAGLEGKRIGSFSGPITFGEIAYILLNQTAVRLLIH